MALKLDLTTAKLKRSISRASQDIKRSFRVIFYTMRESIQIPVGDLLRYSRANYVNMQHLDAHALGDELASIVAYNLRKRFARAATVAAYCHLRNFQTSCRSAIAGLAIGLSILASWWIFALVSTAQTFAFIVISIFVTIIFSSLSLPWITNPKRWQGTRIFIAGLGFAVIASYFLGTLASPFDTLTAVTVDLENANILGLSFFGLALACGAGAFCATSSAIVAYLISRRRSFRLFPRELIVVISARLVRELKARSPGLPTYDKDLIIRDLNGIAKCLRYGTIDSDRIYDPAARKNIKQKFESASNFVVGLQQAIVLEQQSTTDEVRKSLEVLCLTALTELYYYLPEPPESEASSATVHGRTFFRVLGRIGHRLGVAITPLGLTFLISRLDFNIPESVQLWATGVALVWLLGHLFLLLDPRLSWHETKEVINANRPTLKE